MRSRYLVAAVVAVVAGFSAPGDEKANSGWTEDKAAQHWFKQMEIRVTRTGSDRIGYCRNYHIGLPKNHIQLYDEDRNRVLTATLREEVFERGGVTLEIAKDDKGRFNAVTVEVNRCRYFDLNYDGEWDTRCDKRDGNKREIYLEDKWVRVKDSILAFDVGGVEIAFDNDKIRYTWDGTRWK